MTVDCLSSLDECFLRLETDAAHMHIGWTLIAAGEPPTLDQLMRLLAARLERVPRFRQRVLESGWRLHDPVWVDDPSFDLSRHVTSVRLGPPGGRAAVRKLAGELLSVPLDREHPLWRLHLVDGMGDGRFAIVGLAHHALVDGVAAVEMAQLLLDSEPVSGELDAHRFVPAPAPGLLERSVAAAAERARITRSVASLAMRVAAGPSAVGESLSELRRVAGALAMAGAPAPRTSLNRPIGPSRSVAFGELPLHVAKELGRRCGATVNDVVLATAAHALGRYLRRRGEAHPWLRVMVPVSMREARPEALGNRLSAMFVELPVGERDPRMALVEVARQTRECKRAAYAPAIDALLRASKLAPAPVRDALAWLVTRPQTFNATVSNIPGPPVPLYLLGRRVLAAYPAVPLMQGHGLSIGALSYCGTLDVGLYCSPDVVPDPLELARDLMSSFDALRLAIEPRPPGPGARPRARPRTRLITPV